MINLLPQKHKEERRFVLFVNEIFVGVFAIFIFIIIAEILFYTYNTTLTKKVNDASNEITKLTTEISKFSQIQKDLTRVQTKSSEMVSLKNNPAPQSQILAVINHAVSDSIQIQSISSDTINDQLTISGVAKSTDSLSLMQSALQTDEMVKEVSLKIDESSTSERYIFTTIVTLSNK
ncbi:MAG: PilN domain-containing protein [Candidatus Berkelbacteria bacterium]